MCIVSNYDFHKCFYLLKNGIAAAQPYVTSLSFNVNERRVLFLLFLMLLTYITLEATGELIITIRFEIIINFLFCYHYLLRFHGTCNVDLHVPCKAAYSLK